MSLSSTVVIVDDEVSIRRFIRHVLRGAGYGVLEAQNAAEARAAIQAHEGAVALVISDIRMPGGNGLDLGVDLEGTRPGMPVLYISGLIDSVAVQSILLRDPLAILAKPFTDKELVKRVQALIGAAPSMQSAAPPTPASTLAALKKSPCRELGQSTLPRSYAN